MFCLIYSSPVKVNTKELVVPLLNHVSVHLSCRSLLCVVNRKLSRFLGGKGQVLEMSALG